MDFKRFYLSADGRVNRKQWWLWLVLPVIVISIVLAFVDMATGHFDPEVGIGPLSAIFALLALIPSIFVYSLPRPGQVRLVGADRAHPDHWPDLASRRARLPEGDRWAQPFRSTRHRLRGARSVRRNP